MPQWAGYIAWINAKYGTRPATSNNGQFLFAQPVGEAVDADAFSQEFRFTSNPSDSRFDWIGGLYYKKDKSRSRPVHRRELPRCGHPGRQQPAVDAQR